MRLRFSKFLAHRSGVLSSVRRRLRPRRAADHDRAGKFKSQEVRGRRRHARRAQVRSAVLRLPAKKSNLMKRIGHRSSASFALRRRYSGRYQRSENLQVFLRGICVTELDRCARRSRAPAQRSARGWNVVRRYVRIHPGFHGDILSLVSRLV